MVSGCTFHLQSWERRHDQHGKQLQRRHPPLGQARPAWDVRAAIFRPRQSLASQHGGPPRWGSKEPDSWAPGSISLAHPPVT